MKSSSLELGDNKLSTKLLLSIFCQQDEDVITQGLFERLQLYFVTRDYIELIRFIDSQKREVNCLNNLMMQEAMVLAYANLGQFEYALEWLGKSRFHADPIAKYIYSLRECEIKMLVKCNQSEINKMRQLAHELLPFLQVDKNVVDHILIGLYLVDLMEKRGISDDAVKLLYFCLEAAHHIDDEILKTECLIKLYKLIAEPEGKNIIENLMIKHYYQTQYANQRRKMLDCFCDLKHVENKYLHDEMTPLFEDLLILSKSF